MVSHLKEQQHGCPGDQNQFPFSFTLLGDILKALMFLLNLNGFNSSLSLPNQGFTKRKGSSKVWKEKGSKWFCHLFSLPFIFLALLVCFCFIVLSQSSSMHCFVLFYMFLFGFVFSFALFCFSYKKNFEKLKNTKLVCVCVHWYLCTLVG